MKHFANFASEYLKNKNTNFEQYGQILDLAKRYTKYQKNIEHSFLSLDKSNTWSIANANFFSSFFKMLHSETKEGKAKAFEYLRLRTLTPGAQFENILWNTDNNHPNGLLEWKDVEGTKVATGINETFAKRFTYLLYDGVQSNISNRTYAYKDLTTEDFNLIALMDFLQIEDNNNTSLIKSKNNPNGVIYTTLSPSDKTSYYKVAGNKIPMYGGIEVENGEVSQIDHNFSYNTCFILI